MSNQPIDIQSIREEADQMIHTARVSPARIVLLYVILNFVLQMLDTAVSYLTDSSFALAFFSVSFFSILITLFLNVLSTGITCYSLCVCRGGEAGYDYLFDGFSFAGKIVLLTILRGLLIGLGSMFFVFPGLILAYTYALAPSNLCDNPSMGVIAAMRASRQQMDGHKMELFRLHLTFWPQLLFYLAVIVAAELIYPSIPEVFSADMLFTASILICSSVAMLLLVPGLSLATTKFYLTVSAPASLLPKEDETSKI